MGPQWHWGYAFQSGEHGSPWVRRTWGRGTRWPGYQQEGAQHGPSQKAQARVRACCLLPAVGKSQLVLSLPGHKVAACRDADILLQSKHIKPVSLFNKAVGKEETCTEEQASHDRCLQKMQGTGPLEDARAMSRLPVSVTTGTGDSTQLPACPSAFQLWVKVYVLTSRSHSQKPQPGQPGFLDTSNPDPTEILGC